MIARSPAGLSASELQTLLARQAAARAERPKLYRILWLIVALGTVATYLTHFLGAR